MREESFQSQHILHVIIMFHVNVNVRHFKSLRARPRQRAIYNSFWRKIGIPHADILQHPLILKSFVKRKLAHPCIERQNGICAVLDIPMQVHTPLLLLLQPEHTVHISGTITHKIGIHERHALPIMSIQPPKQCFNYFSIHALGNKK